MNRGDQILAAVRRYHEIGWVVHPCCPPDHSCDCPGKIPFDVVGGHHLGSWQDHAQFTIEQWQYFVNTEPNINIGALCGSPSGIVMIDLDNEESINAYRRLEREHFARRKGQANAWRFTTGAGERYIFRHSAGTAGSRKIPTGTGHYIEILGDGRQSVVPPSRHPKGTRYEWSRGLTPRDFTAIEFPIAAFGGAAAPGSTEEIDSDGVDWVKILSAGIHEGDRNNTLARICGHLAKRFKVSEVWFWLKLYNSCMVTPELNESELRKIYNSIIKREESEDSRIMEIMAEYGVTRRHAESILESMK